MPRKAPGRTGNLDTQDCFKIVISHFSVYQSSHTRMYPQMYFKTNYKLRKWVLKSDITKIRKLIMDGANPNFISQQVPDSKSSNVSFQSDSV